MEANNIDLHQKINLLEPLMGFVAHKLNNSLAVINGYTEMVQLENCDDYKLIEKIRKISQASNRMSDFLLQLLLLSDRCPLRFKEHKAKIFVVRLCDAVSKILIDRVDVDLENTDRIFMVDLEQFELALTSLINIFEASTDNKINIKICSRVVDDNLVLDIDILGHIYRNVDDNFFDPFVKESANLNDDTLALLLLYSIVKKHNGTISVQVKDEKLSFEIALPLN